MVWDQSKMKDLSGKERAEGENVYEIVKQGCSGNLKDNGL